MLTIRKKQIAVDDPAGALAAAKYPLDLTDSPQAYREPGDEGPDRANSMWLGSPDALRQFGVKRGAEVKAEHLALVMRGRHVASTEGGFRQVRTPGYVPELVDGEKVLLPDGTVKEKAVIAQYELTLSFPKTVSIVYAVAGGEMRAKIEQGAMMAANATLEHLAMTRPIVDGKAARGFVASATIHVVARRAKGDLVPMPQLHVHCEMLAVEDEKRDIRAPSSSALYKDNAMREAGAVGRAAMAAWLKGLGFPIIAMTGRGGRYFEIDGIADGLRERMSSRTREVRKWIAEMVSQKGGELSGRVQAQGAIATRGSKDPTLSKAFVQEVWRSLCQDFSFNRQKLEALLAAPKVERDVDEVTAEVRATILQRIKEEGPTVSRGEARSLAFEAAPAGITLQQAGDLIARMQEEGELLALSKSRVTTREIRAKELFVEAVAKEAGARRRRPLGEAAVEAGIKTAEASGKFTLDPEQGEAVRKLTAGADWAVLTGRAGTGKGPVLEAVAEAHRHKGWQVIASAVDGATSGRLAVQVRGEALTIAQLLVRLEMKKITIDDKRPTLILIEEASKVGLEHWEKLARICEDKGARIIAIGDTMQIGAIECPGMLDVMAGHEEEDRDGRVRVRPGIVPVARLNEVRRHKDPDRPGEKHPWLEEHLDHLYAGRGEEAIEVLRREKAITMSDTREDAMEAMVARWRERRTTKGIAAKDTILVVHGPNKDVDAVNKMAQQWRFQDGELGREGVQAVDRDYSLFVNDVVMLRETAYRWRSGEEARWERVENGTLGVVSAVDVEADRVEVTFEFAGDQTRAIWIDIGRLREWAADPGRGEDMVPSLRLAYAAHPFPVQGGTWRYVGSLLGHWSQHREDAYVAHSRPEAYLDVFTDKESCGLEGKDDDRYRRLGRRLSKLFHRDASIVYREASGVEIFKGLAEHERVPLLAPSAEAPEVDPLGSYRFLLGDRRLAAIDLRAVELHRAMAELESDELRQELALGRRAVDYLDPAASLEVGRHEHALAVLDEEERRSALEERIYELRDEGRHPDDWVRDQGDAFARGLAAERELRERGEMEEAEGLDRSVIVRVPGQRQAADDLELEVVELDDLGMGG